MSAARDDDPHDRNVARAADRGQILALEAVAARAFPALESQERDGWLLRASRGWTGRGNSAVPLGGDGDHLERLDVVERWYDRRGLPPTVAVPEPACSGLAERLRVRGWEPRHGALVLTARVAEAVRGPAAARGLPAVRVEAVPDDGWLGVLRQGGEIPDHGVDMLRGAGARFASLRLASGEVVAVLRFVVEPPWVGLSVMEVAPDRRRNGLATHLLRGALAEAVAEGARRAWLQVTPDNLGARALYERAGFALHHTYRYHRRP